MPSIRHDLIIAAGTFDVLHDGHFMMLHAAFSHSDFVEIWLVDDAMGASKEVRTGQSISSWAERAARIASWADSQTAESVLDFLDRAREILGDKLVSDAIPSMTAPYTGRHREFELSDALGPAVADSRFTAIVCSDETRAGVDQINALRSAQGLAPLAIVQVPLWMAGTEKLSSSTLRRERNYNQSLAT
jgi:phosphopantetheine adenylyltransferase